MTIQRDLKKLIRERQSKTGESYTAARVHVMRERAALVGAPTTADVQTAIPTRVDAAVLKVNRQSARVRILGEEGQITFRATGVCDVAPGQRVTLVVEKRWVWNGDEYASGQIENPRIDVAGLGLVPLPLHGGDMCDLRERHEPYRRPDLYAPMWRQLTAKRRACFEMDGIAWGAFPDKDPDDDPTCDASELAEAGDVEGAREIMMDVLCKDLRCIDAHAHLGNWVFDQRPTDALLHYEIGVRIGELSLPAGFDGALEWGVLYNRPFLRCLHGYGLCLWRLGRFPEAQRVFERILGLNPNDNQGVRFCLRDVQEGRSWDEVNEREEAAEQRQRRQ